MTLSEQELRRRWAQASMMPRGAAKFEAIDQVLRNADSGGFERLAFDWRMEAISEYHHGGDPARAFLAFSQCLAAFDRDPSLAGWHTEHSLLWRFKWIVWALPQFPDIPLERTYAVLDDMQARYLRSGHSLHAVHQHRWLVAHHIGDASAHEWYEKMISTARDGLSDCEACVPSSQVRHLVTLGRDKEAIKIGAPYSRGGCTEQPHWMLSELLLPYLRTGKWAKAADAHRFGYPRMRNDRHHLDNIAQHVYFCGVSGNETRGLELVERHRGWLNAPSSPYAAMEFAAAGALVLRRLAEAGHGDVAVRAVAGASTSTIAACAAGLAATARGIAALFDARNGNRYQSTRVDARIAAAPLSSRVRLSATDEESDEDGV